MGALGREGSAREGSGLRVTFSKEGLAHYRGEEREPLLAREESTYTFRCLTPRHSTNHMDGTEFPHQPLTLPSSTVESGREDWGGWDNPFTKVSNGQGIKCSGLV